MLSQPLADLTSNTNADPNIPLPHRPVAGSLVETNTPVTFSWQPAAYATSYDIDIVSDTSILASLDASDCSETLCSLTLNLALPANLYVTWRLRSTNATGSSNWAESTFRTINSPTQIPPAPIPLSPAINALISENDVIDFNWAQDPHAITYDFYFFDATSNTDLPLMADLRASDICTDGQCVLTLPINLPVGENHAWLVRGLNSLGASNWSNSTFTVIEAVTFNMSLPLSMAQTRMPSWISSPSATAAV